MLPEDLEARLGTDLAALLAEQPSPPVRIEPVHTLPSPIRRLAAFRVELADGTVLKARRLENQRHATMVGRILDASGDAFPVPIARRGAALLEPWVDGTLAAALEPLPTSLLERCGSILGELHGLPVPAWRQRPIRDPRAFRQGLAADVASLVAADLLDATLVEPILAAGRSSPDGASVGIIHGDFCAENLVVTDVGSVRVIDNATLGFAAHDFDLARTWYRWPMNRAQAAAFLVGYERHRSAAGFLRHFPFWALSALVRSAANRRRIQSGDVETPLSRLRTLCAALARGDVEPWESAG